MAKPGYLKSYLACGAKTTLNVVLYGATLGRFVLLEGRISGGVFSNWIGQFSYRPRKVARPRTLAGISNLVASSRRLRVFGSGHSFNAGVVSEETLVSLDDYSGPLLDGNLRKGRLAVKGGTRVRGVVGLLRERGLAFEAMPSHDAQSMGGILSTDVHGTGRNWGYVNESVESLKIVDGTGAVHECGPEEDLFKAAIGGIGAVGIICEVVVRGVERFNVEQKVETMKVSDVWENLDAMLDENEHLSLYLFPFADRCRVNTWNASPREPTRFGRLWEFARTSADALLAAWGGNLFAYAGLLPRLSSLLYGVESGSNLVLESHDAFNRTLYHCHQELEFTVPFERAAETCQRFLDLYEGMYDEGLPYMIVEVRFTPETRNTLIGAGRGRRSVWIDLVLNDSAGFEKYYREAETLVRSLGGRQHLGKYCEALDETDLQRAHGENFERFLALVRRHDPEGKFANAFTRRLFGGAKEGS
jgi:FAD/FMN-containing dehydrogenase